MTGQDFINLILLKNKNELDLSNRKEVSESSIELTFQDLNKEELKGFYEEYEGYVKAPFVLYTLINREPTLKEKNIETIETYVKMLQEKSDNIDWEDAEIDKFGFEILGSSKKVLGSGVIVPIKDTYRGCIAPEKAEDFLKMHPGYYIDWEYIFDEPNTFSAEELELIKKLESY